MQLAGNFKAPSVFLRIAIAASYLWASADRLGIIGAHGQPHVGWGDWQYFLVYSKQVMSFLPDALVAPLAVIATASEVIIGLLLIMGLFTRVAAVASGLLSLSFALSMAISFGIDAPLNYSVFTLSAASLLLATAPYYAYSLDAMKRLPLCRRLDYYAGDHLIDIIR
ncbi:DoxX family protein [Mucilaginibacter sp.]|uniref:DoxX family protein n=1 Tax=Mucilaginibacter sp. TaxID=1882438 RepID=UPI00326366DB